MNEKEPKIGYVLAFVFVAAVGFSVYWMFLKPNDNPNTGIGDGITTDTNKNEEKDDETKTPTDTTPETQTPVDESINDDEETSDTDFSTYSSTTQTTGESSNKDKYTIKSITDTKADGYHSFVFTVQGSTSEVMAQPYVVAKYSATLGAIRVDLNGVTKDESGLGYQKSRKIDEQGVIKLYHNISSNSSEELYDIGVSKSTVFKLGSTIEEAENTWKIMLNVKYPGSTEGTTSEDFGSDEFSKDPQSIDGGLKADSAKVSAYSFSTGGGVLSLVLTVSGSASRPVPSATAGYNSESKLELTLPSLTSDAVVNALDGKKLGTLTFDTKRTGDKSVYVISGTSKEFKLYGSKSPNQIILEIKQ